MSQAPEQAQIYHYERLAGEWPTRFHLRVDPDGGGILLANAAEAAYLSPVGVLMARHLLEGRDEGAIRADLDKQFGRVPEAQVSADLAAVGQLIHDLSAPGDNYPITNLADPGASSWTRALAAPLRADVDQADPETARTMLQRLWDAAIPHACILVDPDRDPNELPAIAQAAEDLGMICGARAVASWLPPEVIEEMAMAGLDHLDLVYGSMDADAHDLLAGGGDHARVLAAFEQCHKLELCPVAQVPLVDANADYLDEIMAALFEVGVTNAVCFALACTDDDEQADAAGALPARSLAQVATLLVEATEQAQVRYLWAPPVRFDNSRSLAEQVRRGPRSSGDMTIRVQADGSVLPARGGGCAGNVLTDAWPQIWGNDCFARYRERLAAPTRCAGCPDLAICVADCPKDPSGWSDDREGGASQ